MKERVFGSCQTTPARSVLGGRRGRDAACGKLLSSSSAEVPCNAMRDASLQFRPAQADGPSALSRRILLVRPQEILSREIDDISSSSPLTYGLAVFLDRCSKRGSFAPSSYLCLKLLPRDRSGCAPPLSASAPHFDLRRGLLCMHDSKLQALQIARTAGAGRGMMKKSDVAGRPGGKIDD